MLQAFVISGAVIQDNQMKPTLQKDDRVIINKLKTTFNLLGNSDIILYRKGDKVHVSRVIGKPGQSVEYKHGKLYRDDKYVDEPYTHGKQIESLSLRKVKHSEGNILPPDTYFVLNDRRGNDKDSRTFGLIKKRDVIGNVSLKYYPFDQFTANFNLIDEVYKLRKEVIEWIVAIIAALAIFFLVTNFVAKSYTVKGDSMDPTLKDGERVAVNLFDYKLGDIKKGNVIVFHATKNADYVKRVIGTPGDSIEYKKDKLYVNGKKVDEPYLNYNEKHKHYDYITGSFKTKDIDRETHKNKIPKGKLLVLGDNREVSKDSRSFGLIDKDKVVGKVWFRYWPLNGMKFGFDPDTDYGK